MREIVLGSTGIRVPQNAFGALPIQRISKEEAVKLLRKAYDGGIRFFDTARNYTDSEEKVGEAFRGMRDKIILATKTHAVTPEEFWKNLETSLTLLGTDYVDLYQFHCAAQAFAPGDGTGMYECMLEAKAQGKIRHIGITNHRHTVAMEAIESGLYETMQFPFSYLADEKDFNIMKKSVESDMGFLCMKGLAGGLIKRSEVAYAYMAQFDGVLPIWGIQLEEELDEFLSYQDNEPVLDDEMKAFIEEEKKELSGDFCRGCGYCMPCPMEIVINQCNRMSLMIRRAPEEAWTNEHWQKEMAKIDTCLECRQCVSRCPYDLDIPNTLKKNYEDYKTFL